MIGSRLKSLDHLHDGRCLNSFLSEIVGALAAEAEEVPAAGRVDGRGDRLGLREDNDDIVGSGPLEIASIFDIGPTEVRLRL